MPDALALAARPTDPRGCAAVPGRQSGDTALAPGEVLDRFPATRARFGAEAVDRKLLEGDADPAVGCVLSP